jgi:hypothetical protein
MGFIGCVYPFLPLYSFLLFHVASCHSSACARAHGAAPALAGSRAAGHASHALQCSVSHRLHSSGILGRQRHRLSAIDGPASRPARPALCVTVICIMGIWHILDTHVMYLNKTAKPSGKCTSANAFAAALRAHVRPKYEALIPRNTVYIRHTETLYAQYTPSMKGTSL